MEIILAVLAIIGAISGLFKDKSETAEPVPKRKSAPPETVPKQTRRLMRIRTKGMKLSRPLPQLRLRKSRRNSENSWQNAWTAAIKPGRTGTTA